MPLCYLMEQIFQTGLHWGDSNESPKWIINSDGSMTVVNGSGARIQTKESFGSVQLHIEWKTGAEGIRQAHQPQDRSNSGVFFQQQLRITNFRQLSEPYLC